jgi:hypothetical protein
MINNLSFTQDSLRDCLAGLPPVELKGMALLRERRPDRQFFPQLESEQLGIPRETIAEAVTEIVAYTERCRRAAQQLAKLTPIPLTAFSILEYGI